VPCPSTYPPHPNLQQLKNQAKDLRKAVQVADAEAIQRLKDHLPRFSEIPESEIRSAEVSLKGCQHVISREYGFESWNWLQAVVEVDFDLLNRLSDADIQVLLPEVDHPEWVIAFQLVVKLKGRPGLRRTLEGQLAATKLSAQLGKTYQLIIEGLVSTQCGESPRYVARIVRETDSQGDAQRPSRDEIRPTNERSDLNSMAEESQLGKELDFIADLLGQFLGKEDPKTVAGILSRLDTTLTAVFGRLPKAIHGEVVYHLFQLREGPLGLLRWTAQDLGGIEAVAKILNKSTNSIVKQVLDYVDQKDPRLAEQIRNQMFTFEDIARMPDRDIRQLLEQVDYRDMGLALRGVSEKVTSRFLSNMSDSDPLNMTASAKTLVQKQMASSGPVRVLDVEDAQLRIVQQMRQLEEIGRVTIVRGDGDKIL
jgi:flagellar motor switch protein FliG